MHLSICAALGSRDGSVLCRCHRPTPRPIWRSLPAAPRDRGSAHDRRPSNGRDTRGALLPLVALLTAPLPGARLCSLRHSERRLQRILTLISRDRAELRGQN